jgi:TRAP-type C4-dicarboxylate transport system permease small subunit
MQTPSKPETFSSNAAASAPHAATVIVPNPEVMELEATDILEPSGAQAPPRLEWWLMIVIMVFLTGLTLLNVTVRYLTNASFAYTEELSVSLMIALVLIGSACALRRNHHIRVTFLVDRSARKRWMSDMLMHVVALVTFAMLGYYGIRQTMDDMKFNVVSPGLGVPEWWFSIVLPIGCALVCWRAAEGFLHSVRSKGRT